MLHSVQHDRLNGNKTAVYAQWHLKVMKTFTLEEADALVPQINQLLDELIAARDQLAAMGVKLHATRLLQRAGGNGGNPSNFKFQISDL